MLIKVNSRLHSFSSRVTGVERVAPGKYLVSGSNGRYHVEGGKKLGGRRNDWFLSGPHINGNINCTSLIDALNLIDNI